MTMTMMTRTAGIKPKRSARLPARVLEVIQEQGVRPTRYLLTVSVSRQDVTLWERAPETAPAGARGRISSLSNISKTGEAGRRGEYAFRDRFIASTSRYGIGQVIHSNRTPLGLHRIARKIGGDQPEGTVFKGRVPIGRIQDLPDASIVHRILWLTGLEPGFNRGGQVDTFRRYIYIHGFGDETTLGRPMSCGCVHLAARDLIPLYDLLPTGTLVWIGK